MSKDSTIWCIRDKVHQENKVLLQRNQHGLGKAIDPDRHWILLMELEGVLDG